MRSDKPQILSNISTRQKVTAGALVIIVIIIIWQVIGLFGGGSSTTVKKSTIPQATMNAPPPQQLTPQPAPLPKPRQLSATDAELLKIQEQTQTQYITAINQLQMLKVTREIAETNQAIMNARLATITAEKSIVNLLTPPVPQVTQVTYAKGLLNPTPTTPPPITNLSTEPPPQAPAVEEQQPLANYTVISVTQLQFRWGAVVGYQGSLYHVQVGDILPPDGSKVISINKSGIVLQKSGARRKVSLVPII